MAPRLDVKHTSATPAATGTEQETWVGLEGLPEIPVRRGEPG